MCYVQFHSFRKTSRWYISVMDMNSRFELNAKSAKIRLPLKYVRLQYSDEHRNVSPIYCCLFIEKKSVGSLCIHILSINCTLK